MANFFICILESMTMLGMATMETRTKINADYFQMPTFHIANRLVLNFAKLTGQIKQSKVYSRSQLKD